MSAEQQLAELRHAVLCNLGDLDTLSDDDIREVLANLCQMILATAPTQENGPCVPY